VLGAAYTPVSLANVKPEPPQGLTVTSSGSGRSHTWLVVLAIATPVVAFGLVGALELRRSLRGRGQGMPPE
jgi:hypothetical protein